MKAEKDIHSGKTWIQLNDDEIRFGFLSQCVEALARAENCNYIRMFNRLEKADMTEKYILIHYKVLHTESMDNVVSDLRKVLLNREAKTDLNRTENV